MVEAVAVVRGKGVKSRFFLAEEWESKGEFIKRIASVCAMVIDYPTSGSPSNTLTIEYVFNE